MSTTARNERSIVRGLVVPVDWDDDGTSTAFAIATNEGREYSIRSVGTGILTGLLRRPVQATGFVTELADGEVEIEVEEIEAVDQEETAGTGRVADRESNLVAEGDDDDWDDDDDDWDDDDDDWDDDDDDWDDDDDDDDRSGRW